MWLQVVTQCFEMYVDVVSGAVLIFEKLTDSLGRMSVFRTKLFHLVYIHGSIVCTFL